MSDLETRIRKYGSIDVTKYVNELLPRYEESVLQMERDITLKQKEEIEMEIFKLFITNSYDLLEILSTYENVQNDINNLKEAAKELTILKNSGKKNEYVHVNEAKVAQFSAILSKFSNDIKSFDTGRRTLEYFEIVKNGDGKFILIFTNDILIIGKIVPEDSTYLLVNAINYSLIDMKIKDDKLIIALKQREMVYFETLEKMQKICDKFTELNYVSEYVTPEILSNGTQSCADFLEYAIRTGQIELLADMDINDIPNLYRIDHFDKKKFMRFLQICHDKKHDDKANTYIVNYLNEKFKLNMGNVTRITKLHELIASTFDFFYSFYEEETNFINELHSILVVNKMKMTLMIEAQLYMCFDYFENRIFSKRFYSKKLYEIRDEIEQKLRFKGNDFTYLLEYFDKRIEEFNKTFVEEAKSDIRELVNSYINEYDSAG